MDTRTPILLVPELIGLNSPEFTDLTAWPFEDAFVGRLLAEDIPQRVRRSNCQVWLYRDPDGQAVGFGTLDLSREYEKYASGSTHPYIPLLAANPTIKSRGYGTSIAQHLIAEATVLAAAGQCGDILFLDVYTSSEKAIALYTKSGFVQATPEPIPDEAEGGKLYIVMTKNVGFAPS